MPLIDIFVPEAGTLRPAELPRSTPESWSPTSNPVQRYLKQIEALPIPDPTGASRLYAQALLLRNTPDLAVTVKDEAADIAKRLSSGAITKAQASKLMESVPSPKEAKERAQRARDMLTNATHTSYAESLRAIHSYGEHKWLALLRPLIDQAVKEKNQQRWDNLHSFAASLRSIGALSIVASSAVGPRGIEDWRYQFSRPDLCHFWRLRNATRTANIFLEARGDVTFIGTAVVHGPQPTIADFDPSWEPTLLSAAEVVSIAATLVGVQESMIAAAESKKAVAHA